MCFVVYCGCFAGALRCSAIFFKKNSVLRCFAGVLNFLLGRVLRFANVFCRHFIMSERQMHSTVLRCIAQSVQFVRFVRCLFFFLCCAVFVLCFVKNTKTRTQNTTKHQTPQKPAK